MEPWRFDFYQAVRLLERLAAEGGKGERVAAAVRSVGRDEDPEKEFVRFRVRSALSFQPSPVVGVRFSDEAGEADGDVAPTRAEMDMAFFGLTGAGGALPEHYTQLLIRLEREKDRGMRDFFDLFNHRLVSHLFRAWEKYRLPTAYERARSTDERDDPITRALFSLVGLGTDGLRDRLPFGDELFLHFGGVFAEQRRSAQSLGRLLTEYFGVPVCIAQFQGRWLPLRREDLSALASPGHPRFGNNGLGETTILGSRVWDVQGKIRVHVGPLDFDQYSEFTPSGRSLEELECLVRSAIGLELDFDVQVALRRDEVPACQLGAGTERPGQLGWNTWLRTRPFDEDFDGAVFTPRAHA